MATHIIDEVIFDISFDSMRIANENETAINHWVVTDLLPAVDKILNEFDETDQILRIERLEIDLGDIPGTDFLLEIIHQLDEKLRAQLRDIKQNLTSRGSQSYSEQHSRTQQISQTQADFEKTYNFLMTGNLPWHVNTADSGVHEKIMDQLLQQADGALQVMWEQTSLENRNILIKRLINQYPRRYLEQALTQLSPRYHDLLLDFIQVCQLFLIKMEWSSAQQTRAMDLIWRLTFSGLVKALSIQNPSAFILEILQKSSHNLKLQSEILVSGLLQIASARGHALQTRQQLAEILSKLSANLRLETDTLKEHKTSDSAHSAKAGNISKNKDFKSDNGQLSGIAANIATSRTLLTMHYQRMLAALRAADIPLPTLSDDNVVFEAQHLRQHLLTWLGQTNHVQRAADLPAPILLDILCLLSLQAAGLFETLHSQADLLYRQPPGRRYASASAWQRQLAETALTWLTTRSAAPANTAATPAAFLYTLARGMTATSPARLLHAWEMALRPVAGTTVLQTILREAARQTNDTDPAEHIASQSAANDARSVVSSVIAAADHAGNSGAEIPAMIAAPTADSKTWRQHLQTDLQADTLRADRLSATALKKLVQTVLQHDPTTTDTDRQLFLQAIENHAQQTSNVATYYQQLLDTLLHAQPVDLDAIAAQSTREPSQPGLTAAATTAGEQSVEQRIEATESTVVIYQRMLAALRAADIPLPEVPDDNAVFETQHLRQHLLTWLGQTNHVQRAADLPTLVLLDIICLLSPQAAGLFETLHSQANLLYRQPPGGHHASAAAWQRQLAETALTWLATRSTAPADTSAAYLYALARGMTATSPARLLHAWETALRPVAGTTVLQTILRETAGQIENSEREPSQPGLTAAETTASEQNVKQRIEATESAVVIYQHMLAALRAADIPLPALSDSSVFETQHLRQHLLIWLRQANHVQQAADLPTSVLLDIIYLLSPQAASLFEALHSQADLLYRQPPGSHYASAAAWQRQLAETALTWLATRSANTANTSAAFLHALAREMTTTSPAQLLHAWETALRPVAGTTVLRMILREIAGQTDDTDSAEHIASQSATNDARSVVSSVIAAADHAGNLDTEMPVMTAAPAADFKVWRQHLQTALQADRLSATALKELVQTVLQQDPTTAGTDRQLFLQAIESHAQQTSNVTAYYRQLLDTLLHAHPVDLAAIAAQSTREPSQPGLTAAATTAGEQSVEQRIEATESTVVIYQRMLAALRAADIPLPEVPDNNTVFEAQYLRQHLLTWLGQTNHVQRAADLPAPILLDILCLLSPQAAGLFEALHSQADLLYRQPPGSHYASAAAWQRQLTETALTWLATRSAAPANTAATLAAYLYALARGMTATSPAQLLHAWETALRPVANTTVLQMILRMSVSEKMVYADLLTEKLQPPQYATARSEEDSGSVTRHEWRKAANAEIPGQEFYIDNAGQILAAPYLPRFFNMLGLVEQHHFIDPGAAERAMHLLQFMVNEQTQSPEYQLLLNRILCGLPLGIPVCRRIDISQHEQDAIEGLLRGMIQNWAALGKTSIGGLRETFLQRKGKLHLQEDGMWQLTIDPGPFDMLLDRLPWSFSVIRHAWMERAVHVTWR